MHLSHAHLRGLSRAHPEVAKRFDLSCLKRQPRRQGSKVCQLQISKSIRLLQMSVRKTCISDMISHCFLTEHSAHETSHHWTLKKIVWYLTGLVFISKTWHLGVNFVILAIGAFTIHYYLTKICLLQACRPLNHIGKFCGKFKLESVLNSHVIYFYLLKQENVASV